MTGKRRTQPYRAHLLALEPRMMFDAAAAVVVQDAIAGGAPDAADMSPAAGTAHDEAPARDVRQVRVDGPGSIVDRWHDKSAFRAERLIDADDMMVDGSSDAGAAGGRVIIFIDTAVADYRQLAADWAGKGELHLIDATRDGIDQVKAALAGRSDIAAIHIVSHGSDGVLQLGTTRLDGDTIAGKLAGSLGDIGRSLTADGDILIYGCDFAAGPAGARALAAFAQATGADVAASTDTTGYAARGGDWDLEAHDGAVEAMALADFAWVHTLDPNTPVPIAVSADTLTVRDGGGNIVTSGTNGYGTDNRSPDVGAGATAVWENAATFNGNQVDLRATVVSISAGDAVRFNRPGLGANADDPTFLLRDLTTGASDATVQIRWELIDHATGNPLPADVRFTIADIDGIGGNPNTRESVTASTTGLAYYTRERITDIDFNATLSAVTASGTQNENTNANLPVTPASAATFDWSEVSAFTLTYKLTVNAVTTQAQFFHDGDADFVYTDPVYVSIPRLDLDGNNSTAPGNDALTTFTENGARVPIADSDLVVENPMPSEGITGATVRLTNWHTGDNFQVGTLPAGITATIGPVVSGTQTITFSGTGSETDYANAFRAITFANSSEAPNTDQRVIEVTFSNDTLTSATAISRINVIAVQDPPVANPDTASTAEDRPVTIAVLTNDVDPDGDPLTVTAASAANGTVVINPNGTLTYTPNANFNGTDTINYTISDGNGGTSTTTVTVRVAPQPDAPVNAVPGAQTIAEDGVLTFSTANGNALSISDVDGGTQQVTITVTKGTFTLGSLTGLTFTTGDGAADTTMTFTGSIAQINAALQNAHFDPFADANGAAQLTLTTANVLVEGEDFQNGDAEAPFVPDGQYRFVPEGQVPGWETTASDGQIEIWGNGYQGVPAYQGRQFFEINATQAASLYQEVRSIGGSPVTLNFAHRGRAGVDVMRVTATDLGADGVFGTADDVVIFQQNFSDGNTAWGAYSRQLTGSATGNLIRIDFSSVSTASGDPSVGNFLDGVVLTQNGPATSDTDTVAINITPVADIAPDSVTTAEDTPVNYDPFANDSFENLGRTITEIDGQAIVAGGAAVTVANGRVTLGSDGHLTFTPNANYNGTTTFTYTVTSNGARETATETITVTPVQDAPVPVGSLPPRTGSDAGSVNIATAAGFTDPDGDTLTYSANGLPAGLSIDTVTGVITGTLGRSASQLSGGVYTIVVTARDPSNGATTQTFTLTVTNPPPTAVNDSATTAEDTPVTITVLTNDSDPDGDPLTVTAASALHGTVVRNPDGTLTYTPNADFNGTDTITYTISDGEGGTATATVAITVTAVNDAPVAVGTLPARTGVDGGAVSFGTASGFSDPDGDPLTYSATGLPAGLSINTSTGVVSGTIDRSASQAGGGACTVVVTVRDPSGLTRTQSFGYTVTNPPPQAVNDTATTAEDTPVTITVLTNDSDPDGDPLTVVSASALNGTVVVNANGSLTYSPNRDFNGTDTITYRITDGQGGFATATVAVTITPVNDAPTPVGTPPARNGTDGTTVSFATAPNFADVDGDALTYSAVGLPAGLTIDPNTGVISGRLDRSASQVGGGVYQVTVTARDPSGATAVQRFVFSVANPGPVAVDDRATTRPATPVDIPVLTNDGDPDGDPLSVTAASAANGTVVIQPGGIVRYTPNAGFSGTDTITYTISDGQGGTATAVVRVDVVNSAPSATPPPDMAARDGDAIVLPIGMQFSDPDGDPLTFRATGLPPGLTIDPATGTIRGTIQRSASQTNGGRYESIITADDGKGGVTNVTLRWTVANTVPVARDDAATTVEDTPVTIPVLSNDTDADGDPLTIVAASAGHGTVTINPNGTLTYTPDRDFNGTDTIAYLITDSEGGRSSASVTVTVTPVNDAPTTTGLPPRMAADGATVTIPLAGAFSDAEGGPLTYVATGLPPGLTLDPATGMVTGTIVPGSNAGGPNGDGRFIVTVTVTDPQGARVITSFEFRVDQAAPMPGDDTATTVEDTPVTIPVLANDLDPDNDPLTVVGAVADHGSVAISGGNLIFTPAPDFTGIATIVYTVTDPNGNRATATVMVTVTPVNDAPRTRAIPDQAGRDAQPVTLDIAPFFTDPEGTALRFTATGLPPGLAIDPVTGRISGTIDRNASAVSGGIHRVTITASDGALTTTNSFSWTVINPPPVAANDSARTTEDTPVVIPVLPNDSDPDGDPLTVLTARAGNGTVTIGSDGRLTYAPGPNFAGSDLILYTIGDSNGGQATAYVTVTIDPVNDAPVIPPQNGVIEATSGRPLVIDVLRPIVDPDGDRLTVVNATTANGTVTINPDGTLRYTPNFGFVGTSTISYRISDGHGGFADGALVINVQRPTAGDVEGLLRIGRVTFVNPPAPLATIRVTGGDIPNPLSLLDSVERIRSLNATRIGGNPIGDAVDAIRSLNGTRIDGAGPVAGEVERLERLSDHRDAGDRLYDHRWNDFQFKGLTGFSAAADRDACVMVESVMRDGAIYLEVRDIATDHRAAIRAIDIRTANGGPAPEWIKVDPRGLAIIERGADMDELHLIVRVTREDGRVSNTPIVIQGATGEIELDRQNDKPTARAAPLDRTLQTPSAAQQAIAARLANSFK